MKRTMVLLLCALFTISIAWAQAPVEKKSSSAPVVKAEKAKTAKLAKGEKSISGIVVNIVNTMTSPTATALDKKMAADMAKRGELIGLKSGSKIYILVNSDGSSAAAKLADKASGKVTVTGKVVSKFGLNVIIVNTIN